VNKTIISIGILASCVTAWALVTAYHVEPRTAAMSGWTSREAPGNRVSEVLTVNFDSLTHPAYVELFAGEKGQGGDYNLSVRTYPGDIKSGLDVV
jgi:hypothetical protein